MALVDPYTLNATELQHLLELHYKNCQVILELSPDYFGFMVALKRVDKGGTLSIVGMVSFQVLANVGEQALMAHITQMIDKKILEYWKGG